MSFTRTHFYTFETIAPNFIGARYANMKLTDILSFPNAIKKREDLVTVNQNIVSNVPGAVNLAAADLEYLEFISPDGQKVILAKQWIDANTIVDITELGGGHIVTYKLQLANLDDITIINNNLKELGYINFDIGIETL